MIKFLACVIIVASSSFFGLYATFSHRRRTEQLGELQRIFNFVKNEIVVFNSLLPDIFVKIAEISASPVGLIFENTLKELGNSQNNSLEWAWKNAIDDLALVLNLDIEDLSIVKNFGAMLEKTDIEGQQRNIDYINSKLKYQEKKASDKYKLNEKLIKFSGILTGLAVCILLY